MEDSGWYKAIYAAADPLRWGYKYGCEFLRTCDMHSPPPPRGFCDMQEPQPQCSFDRSGVGTCVGSGVYMEGCPFVAPSYLCSNWNGAAVDAGKGQMFTSTSACFESSLLQNGAAVRALSKSPEHVVSPSQGLHSRKLGRKPASRTTRATSDKLSLFQRFTSANVHNHGLYGHKNRRLLSKRGSTSSLWIKLVTESRSAVRSHDETFLSLDADADGCLSH
jgi:hypothetical protein